MIVHTDATNLSLSTDVLMRARQRPLRILHVLGGMDRGGAETWLMHILRRIDTGSFQMDFLVHTDRRCAYDDEIEGLGSHLHYCGSPTSPLSYAPKVFRLLRGSNRYDIVHSHVHHFSGLILTLARAAGVKATIAHSHNDTREAERQCSSLRAMYLRLGRHLISLLADRKVAVSDLAGDCLFGSAWERDPQAFRLYCGIDLGAFNIHPNRDAVRQQLGLRPSHFVIGHVGRFHSQKNHEFLLHIHAEVFRSNPNARLLLVGEGPLMAAAQATARALGISNSVVFAASRTDVPILMTGAMDVFVMPSLYEGLPLVALEAQAAGLPTLLSEAITREVDTHSGLVKFLPINRGPAIWAKQVLQYSNQSASCAPRSISHLQQSPFSIHNSLTALCNLYTSMCDA